MELLIFDLVGYFAHFRRFYSTTSSLSYAFPPRTTVSGIVAAILGLDRDSYYEIFSSERARISVRLMTSVRRITQTVNYLHTKKEGNLFKKFMGMHEPTQIPTEILASEDFSPLRYRIYFSHKEEEFNKELRKRLEERRTYYPIYLGTAFNSGFIDYVGVREAFMIENKNKDLCNIGTVIPKSSVEEIVPHEGLRIYLEERVPADFFQGRKIKRVEDYIYEGRGRAIPVRLRSPYFRIKGEVDGTFL